MPIGSRAAYTSPVSSLRMTKAKSPSSLEAVSTPNSSKAWTMTWTAGAGGAVSAVGGRQREVHGASPRSPSPFGKASCPSAACEARRGCKSLR
eukprot:scaffold135451_cov32-Tisochrysis_lutea.AAC.5